MDLPELVLVKVLSRFSLKRIARLRLISREWKSLLDSDFFRDHYLSLNSSSSVSWSIIQTNPHKLSLEIVGHHGCERWGLSRSPGSLMSFFPETTITKLLVLSCTDGLVLIYAEDIYESTLYYVGNPLLQEWVRIPLPPFFYSQQLKILRDSKRFGDNGLVTKMQNGIVVSYKVVWMFTHNDLSGRLDFMIYSSDSGMWENQNATCLNSDFRSTHYKSIALNGILHWLSRHGYDAVSIVAYDFYGDDGCCIIPFPGSQINEVTRFGKDDEFRRFRRNFTISEGSIVYFNEFYENKNSILRVWRLVKYIDGPEAWQLSWELNLVSFIGYSIQYFPVVMHPFNSEIIYLWSRNKKALVLFNLRTHVFSLHKEATEDGKCMDGCTLSFKGCGEYMEDIDKYSLPWYQGGPNQLFFTQYVLPRWLHRLPRPQPT